MPYQWIDPAGMQEHTAIAVKEAAVPSIPNVAHTASLLPVAELHLWPHRSLPRRGFVAFLGTTGALMSLPLIMVIGTPILWGLLPFLLLTLGGVWCALECSYRSGMVVEELKLWPNRVTLTRHHYRAGFQEWDANPHWVQAKLYHDEGPVTPYVTLRGGGREVGIGSFLSEAERCRLYDELCHQLRALHDPANQFLRGARAAVEHP